MRWAQLKSWMFFVLWIFAGLFVFFWAVYLGINTYRFQKHAVVLQGVVSGVRTSASDGVWVSSPTVKYFLPDGRQMEYASRFASSSSSYSVGDSVEILWDPTTGKARLKAFGDLYFPAVFVLLVALFILFVPVFSIIVWLWIWKGPRQDHSSHIRGMNRLNR